MGTWSQNNAACVFPFLRTYHKCKINICTSQPFSVLHYASRETIQLVKLRLNIPCSFTESWRFIKNGPIDQREIIQIETKTNFEIHLNSNNDIRKTLTHLLKSLCHWGKLTQFLHKSIAHYDELLMFIWSFLPNLFIWYL